MITMDFERIERVLELYYDHHRGKKMQDHPNRYQAGWDAGNKSGRLAACKDIGELLAFAVEWKLLPDLMKQTAKIPKLSITW